MKRVEKFKKEQILELQGLINKNGSSKAEALRAQAVLLINEENQEYISMLTGLDGKYAFKLRKKYLEKGLGALIDKRKKKPRALLTRGQREQITKVLTESTPKAFGFEHDYWTTAILGFLIKEQYGVHYKSKTPLYLLFKESKFSFHKPSGQYHKHDQEEIDLWKETMKPVMQAALAEDSAVILVADEMILSTQTTFQKVWLPQGNYPKIDISNKRARRCIYGFLNIKTGQEHAFKTEKINSEVTCKILDQIGALYPDKKIILIWDGAPWHRSDAIKEFLSSTKFSFQLYRFPPYAPEENPQEHVWKEGRSKITHNEFIEDIDASSDRFVKYLNDSTFAYRFF